MRFQKKDRQITWGVKIHFILHFYYQIFSAKCKHTCYLKGYYIKFLGYLSVMAKDSTKGYKMGCRILHPDFNINETEKDKKNFHSQRKIREKGKKLLRVPS